MPAPHEIVVGPAQVWLAPADQASPAINATPSSPWVLLGTAGNKRMSEGGVRLSLEQTINEYVPEGDTLPAKAFRTAEPSMVAMTFADFSLEELVKALNHQTVTDVAAGSGTAGYREVDLQRGFVAVTRALLVRRADGPYNDAWPLELWFPRTYIKSNLEPAFSKGAPAELTIEFGILAAASGPSMRVRAMDANPT